MQEQVVMVNVVLGFPTWARLKDHLKAQGKFLDAVKIIEHQLLTEVFKGIEEHILGPDTGRE